jgi:hypothetical protein
MLVFNQRGGVFRHRARLRAMLSRNGFFAGFLTAMMVSAASSMANASMVITINKAAQQMSVSVDGVPRYTWPVSTGRAGYATPSGSFTPFRLEEDHYSKEWDDAPMPHSIFFTKDGHAIHGSYETRRLGSAASHGCVRLAPANAAKLFELVKTEGLANTKVVLSGNAPASGVARRGDPARAAYRQPRYPSPYAAQRGYYQQPYGMQPYGYQQGYWVQPQYPAYQPRVPFPY